MENHHFNGKIHYKWSFSIAMLNYQRVNHIFDDSTPGSFPRPSAQRKKCQNHRSAWQYKNDTLKNIAPMKVLQTFHSHESNQQLALVVVNTQRNKNKLQTTKLQVYQFNKANKAFRPNGLTWPPRKWFPRQLKQLKSLTMGIHDGTVQCSPVQE